MKIAITLAFVFGTYVFFWLTQVVLNRFGGKNKIIANLAKIMPVVSLIVWLVVFFRAIKYLFDDSPYYIMIIIISVTILGISLGWFFVKDFIAGVIFKTQNNFTAGDFLQFEETSGIIQDQYLTHISIESGNGKTLKIPYSRLSNSIITSKTDTKSLEGRTALIKISKENDIKETEARLLGKLTISPWRIPQKAPHVKFIEETEDSYFFEILVHVLNEKHFGYIVKQLESKEF